MPYIDLEQTQQFYQIPLFWILAVPVVVLGLVLLVALYFRGLPWSELIAEFLCFLIAGFMLGTSFTLPDVFKKQAELRTDQLSAVQKQINNSYGIDLTAKELRALSYPEDEPSQESESFGSFLLRIPESSGRGFTNQKVTLVWVDGKMVLAESTNGEDFTP